jgi:catechol 2,3-dioxygenase-like lactoylglutathione lyase family enzyme
VFDHVTLRVSDVDASLDFYEAALETLGHGEPYRGGHFFEWDDLSISAASADKAVTRGMHIGCVAPSRGYVDRFWRVLSEKGYRGDGPPGVRAHYRPEYYAAFVLDPDGNSIEAVHHDDLRSDGWLIDHVWMRVRNVAASKRFYETIAPPLAIHTVADEPRRAQFRDEDASLTVVASVHPTQNVHLAFPAPDNATVDEFHRIALAAGYRDNGAPGERRYHPGYYGAFVFDPDGNNVEAVCHNR